jgi:hypothetical protein
MSEASKVVAGTRRPSVSVPPLLPLAVAPPLLVLVPPPLLEAPAVQAVTARAREATAAAAVAALLILRTWVPFMFAARDGAAWGIA